MLFGASFLSVSAFRKLSVAGSRHDPNDRFEPGRFRFHADMIDLSVSEADEET